MIDKGLIPHYKIGGKILIAELDLENLLNTSYRPSYYREMTAGNKS